MCSINDKTNSIINDIMLDVEDDYDYKLINYNGYILIGYKSMKNNQYVIINKNKIFINYKGVCDISNKKSVFTRTKISSDTHGDYYSIKNKNDGGVFYYFLNINTWYLVRVINKFNIMKIEILMRFKIRY